MSLYGLVAQRHLAWLIYPQIWCHSPASGIGDPLIRPGIILGTWPTCRCSIVLWCLTHSSVITAIHPGIGLVRLHLPNKVPWCLTESIRPSFSALASDMSLGPGVVSWGLFHKAHVAYV